MSIKKISIIGCLIGLMGLNSFATIVGFQQGNLSLDGSGISGAYQTDVCHVISNLADNNYNNASYAYMGTSSATSFRHLLMGFDLSYIETLAGGNAYTINSVELKLTQYNQQAGSGPSTFAMHVTGAFDETTATWNNPGAGHAAGGTVGSLLSTAGLDTASPGGTVYSFTGASWITAVENALADPSNTFYALGKRNSEGGDGSYFILAQSDEGSTHGIDGRPELVVNITVDGIIEPPVPGYETIEWNNDMSVDPVGDVGNEWVDRNAASTYTMGGGVLTMAAGAWSTVLDSTPYDEFLGVTTVDLEWRATSDDTDSHGRGAGLWCNVSGDPGTYGSIHFDSVLSSGSQTFKIFNETTPIVSIPGFGTGMLTLHAVIDSDALTLSYEVTDGTTTESGSTAYTESAAPSGTDHALTLFTAAPSAEIDSIKVVRLGITTYASWANKYGLTGSDTNMTADVEPDGLVNLMEYALGGNPTNDDAAVFAPVSYTAVDGGTNWFFYVHNERIDDIGTLTYTLGTETDLVNAPLWSTNDVVVVGESAAVDGIKSVTNRTDLVDGTKFIKLSVEN